MSSASDKRSEEFLKISSQFKLGALVTESSHPITANLSDVAKTDIAAALDLLFQVDHDVVTRYREFAASGGAGEIKNTVLRSLKNGGRIFFTGCGSTGRLSIQLVSIWRDFWQQQRVAGNAEFRRRAEDFEDRLFSVMAGGDYALIKSVEGFEDFAAFGRKQLADLGVSKKDVVLAITEGGETSFVIGTAWQGLEAGAKVYFVYNNPDDVLRRNIERSREVIDEPRIEKINLTTGPMAITGSTRMQATSIQLCVLLTVLEMVVRELMNDVAADVRRRSGATKGNPPPYVGGYDADVVPKEFLARLEEMHASLRSPEVRAQLAKLVALEESIYRAGRRNNYFADRLGIDALTDTTERSPTYCTPPFRKFDDAAAAESWSFLFLPDAETPQAWRRILKREPRCVEWGREEVRELAGDEKAPRVFDTVRKISRDELMRFTIGLDGLGHRKPGKGDSAIAIVAEQEIDGLLGLSGFYRVQLEKERKAGVRVGLICFGGTASLRKVEEFITRRNAGAMNIAPDSGTEARSDLVRTGDPGREYVPVMVPTPANDFLLDGVTRVGVKLLLNALSTCTMVRLGRVMGNTMVWVVPSNLKLIDRSTRYIAQLTGLNYDAANRLLFEVIEYVEPRMRSDQAYPPVVGLAVLRAKHGLSNEDAERRLADETAAA